MTDNRRLHQCHRSGCDHEAHWQLCLQIQCVGIGRDRIKLVCPSTIRVCNKHTKSAIEFLMTGANKERIGQGLLNQGFPPPDFSSAVAVFEPLDHAALVTEHG